MRNHQVSPAALKTTSTVVALVAIPLVLFRFWPFTVAFMLLGAVATFVISLIVGHAINYLLVLIVEFILMELAMLLVIFYYGRKRDYVP